MRVTVVFFLFVLAQICAGDVLVQLNVNRPFNDVNEKFISFALKPEDLYRALDGPNRKSLTRMASLLTDSYVKFVGDYYFASNSERKLRNPTKVIWKGFNRWSRAVNWTMIIPVPYAPDSWDPMLALKILNTSYSVGISDCIWQLGNDFGSTRARNYVNELETLNLMVDSFKPYVDDWQIMGADISAGSSPDETRRYIEMSKDLNAAFGWTHPAELTSSNSLSNYIYSNDPALKMLFNKKVPVWLTLPSKPKSSRSKTSGSEDIADAINWAQALGDAASSGFDAIFKRISLYDLEVPNHSFYVTALFKKVMGSRVFHSRPLGLFIQSKKLYTHCANAVSGGIAFMVANIEDTPVTISLRSLTQLSASEVWQYTMTFKSSVTYLNGEKLSLNSTLRPLKKAKNPLKPIQLNTPGKSVSFWVLPNVNVEHCQFTEIETGELEKDSSSEEKLTEQEISSANKLLKKLIQESALSQSELSKIFNRRRRYATFANRPKRFLLEDEKANDDFKLGLEKLFDALAFDEKPPTKRESRRNSQVKEKSQQTAFDWLRDFMEANGWDTETPLLKRNTRSTDDYFGSLFNGKSEAKKTSFTKKIFDIKQPEKNTKPFFDPEEFDEEEFFKKISEQTEPEYRRLPDGDVLMKHIATLDGEEVEEQKESPKNKGKLPKKVKANSNDKKDNLSETRPLRLLPTEFYEALPSSGFKSTPTKMSIGTALNSLLFPEPFTKKSSAKSNKKSKNSKDSDAQADTSSGVEEVGSSDYHKNGQLAKDFLRAQMELGRTFLKDQKQESSEEKTENSENSKSDSREFEKRKLIDFLAENLETYFGEKAQSQTTEKSEVNEKSTKSPENVPWWDVGILRKKRSLHIQLPDESWQDNMISKDDDLTPLGSTMPELISVSDINVKNAPMQKNDDTSRTGPNGIVATVKRGVTKFVDIVRQHVNEWYKTLSGHIEVIETANSVSKNERK